MKNDSLEKKVAQLLIVGIPGTSLDRQQLDRLSRIGIGGVILFKRNWESLQQIVSLTNSIQKAVASDSYDESPAWIAVDQEGGRVARFKEPFSSFPSLQHLGKINSPKTCFEMGFVQGKELMAAGVNVNFSPCVDVHQPGTSDVIGDRAFSSDPEQVAVLGSALSRGLQKGGVVSVAKHFPGHGSVEVDSHLDLPISQKTAAELGELDWIPYKRMARARTEGVMTAHISFPKIDPARIATLSRKFVQDYLRQELRFSRLVFTDDLEMGAVQKNYSLDEACFLAVEAGCDQLLVCHSFDQIEDIWQRLVDAFRTGALSESRLNESLKRIHDAKQRFLRPFQFADFEFAKALIGNPEFEKVALAIRDGVALSSGPSDLEKDKE